MSETTLKKEEPKLGEKPKENLLSGREGKENVAADIKGGAKAPPKKKRTRKKKEPEITTVPPEQAKQTAEQFVNFALKMPLDSMAKRIDPMAQAITGDKEYTFALGEMEGDMWKESVTSVIQVMDFGKFSTWMPWLSLAFCCVATGLPRLSVIMTLRKLMKEQQPQKENKNDGTKPDKPNNNNGNKGGR